MKIRFNKSYNEVVSYLLTIVLSISIVDEVMDYFNLPPSEIVPELISLFKYRENAIEQGFFWSILMVFIVIINRKHLINQGIIIGSNLVLLSSYILVKMSLQCEQCSFFDWAPCDTFYTENFKTVIYILNSGFVLLILREIWKKLKQ